jgi:hypothetical protein
LARECGWTKDYIADNLTVEQIKLYYEKIQNQKLDEVKLNAMATMNAVAVAFGSIKFEKFKEFLDKLDFKAEKKDPIDEMKKAGLPVEDK